MNAASFNHILLTLWVTGFKLNILLTLWVTELKINILLFYAVQGQLSPNLTLKQKTKRKQFTGN